MNIDSFDALVFQVNLVNAFSFLDNRGKLFAKALDFSDNKLIENSDTLKVYDDEADYSLNTSAFAMKLKKEKLESFIKNNDKNGLVTHVNKLNKLFIERTKTICNLLQVEKISRFACRFVVNYKDLKDKDIQEVFNINKSLLEKDLRLLKNEISINGLIIRTAYNGLLLNIDIDKYINTNQFDVNEIDDKYNKILQGFRENIFIPKTLIKESF